MIYNVRFTRRADRQIERIYRYIANKANHAVALSYIERLTVFCYSLQSSPHRGDLRPDIGPGARVIGFEHKVSVQFVVVDGTVQILNLAFHGQDYARYFAKQKRKPKPLP